MTGNIDNNSIDRLLRVEPFTAADRTFVSFLQDTYQEADPRTLLAAALCLVSTRNGHSFLDVSQPEQFENALPEEIQDDWPSPEEWDRLFESSPSVGEPEDALPLVYTKPEALYLNKYYFYEHALSRAIFDRVDRDAKPKQPSEDDLTSDLQLRAVSAALSNTLFLISGGPGTGKTTTVLKYLHSILANADENASPRIAAAAPTGKAAARLAESIQSGINRLDIDESLVAQLRAVPCMTIHRLLGGIPHRARFKRHRSNPLEHDVIVVDECSMIDLPLMQKLVEAIRDDASLVLLGDHHQLSSVEVGSVFGDLNQAANDPESPLYGHSTTLEKTYRFSGDSSIFRLCQACKAGDSLSFLSLLENSYEDFDFHALDPQGKTNLEPILAQIEAAHQARTESGTLQSAYRALGRFIALTPFNKGPFGARAISHTVDQRIRKRMSSVDTEFHAGMPIIVLENNYDLELFNGDIGIVWPDEESGRLFAWFGDSENELKRVHLDWLPKHDLAYCLTIHKSQGSEFDHVAGIFPPEDTEFISRELVYTCCSRARQRFSLFGNKDALASAIQRTVKRATRLENQIKAATE